MASSARRRRAAAKAVVWMSALTPLAWLGWRARHGQLGANPIEEVLDKTGWWGLVLLTITLAVTPVRWLTGWHAVVRYRRLVGLFAFFYLTLHFGTYLVLDQWFAWTYIVEDIAERPFITVGFAAWLLLLTLAVTSTRGWTRRLGARWQRLQRLIYLASALGVLHFYWKVKADTREPLIFATVVGLLLGARVPVIQRMVSRLRTGPAPRRTVAIVAEGDHARMQDSVQSAQRATE
jgi:sulfoxide reductase heme-binding subunit YedZ